MKFKMDLQLFAMSAAAADAVLTANYGSGAYVQLHIGNPGAAGTANIAAKGGGNAPRKQAAFGSVGSHPSNTERRVLSSGAVSWAGTDIDAAQEITHISLWSAATGGDVFDIAALTTPKTTGSDGVTIDAGDLEIAIGVFAKPA